MLEAGYDPYLVHDEVSCGFRRRACIAACSRPLETPEIDLDAPLEPNPSVTEIVDHLLQRESLPFSGLVPFEFETRRCMLVRQVSGHIVNASEELNDTGEIGTMIRPIERASSGRKVSSHRNGNRCRKMLFSTG